MSKKLILVPWLIVNCRCMQTPDELKKAQKDNMPVQRKANGSTTRDDASARNNQQARNDNDSDDLSYKGDDNKPQGNNGEADDDDLSYKGEGSTNNKKAGGIQKKNTLDDDISYDGNADKKESEDDDLSYKSNKGGNDASSDISA